MYSIQRDSNNSFYETMNCIRRQQQQQQPVFNNRQMIKTKQYIFWSRKYNQTKDILPVYQTPCTFQKTRKDNSTGTLHRSPLLSSCVPDVYSPGSNGKCSLPPPSSNLPPPPSEWLH